MDHPNRVEDMDGEVFPQLVGDFPEESKTKGQKEHLNPHSVVEKLDDGAVSILKDMFVAKSDRKDSTDTTFNPVKLEEKHSPVEKQDIFDGAVSSSFSSLAEEDANTRTLPDEETFLSYRNPALNKISVPSSLESDHSDDMNMFENAKGYEEEFEYKYHRVFSDFKHYRMQKELEVDTLEDRHAAESVYFHFVCVHVNKILLYIFECVTSLTPNKEWIVHGLVHEIEKRRGASTGGKAYLWLPW